MPIKGSFGAGSARGFGSGGLSPLEPFNANILVVGGGGGASGGQGGGGGAGGYRFNTSYAIAGSTSYKITVGAGGANFVTPDATDSAAPGSTSSFNT